MARLILGNNVTGGLLGLFDDISLNLTGLVTERVNGSTIRMSAGGFDLVIKGNGMAAAIVDGLPVATGGTVHKITLTGPDGVVFKMSNLGWSFVDLSTAMIAEATDNTAMDDFILANSFTYVGNNNADILQPLETTDAGVPLTFAGNDRFLLKGGDDEFFLGAGNDRAVGGTGNDTIGGEDGNDRIQGQAGNDLLMGGDGNDKILGNADDDDLFGSFGNDTLKGGSGNDELVGGDGNDIVLGDDGDDKLSGYANDDVLVGGSGADVFQYVTSGTDTPDAFTGIDVIRDFAVGEDSLELGTAHTWVIISTGSETLVLQDGGTGMITLRGVETGTLTVADLI